MRLCNTDPQINCFTFSHLYVVVQLVWIVAFLVSTKFEHFRCQPPGKISYCCFGAPVLCTGALFCTLFLIRKRLRPYEIKLKQQEIMQEVGNANMLTKALIDRLINKVYVFPGDRIEIEYATQDFLETKESEKEV